MIDPFNDTNEMQTFGSIERDPNGIDPHSAGAKLDAGKVGTELIQRGFDSALLAVADVGSPQGRKPLSMAAQPEPIRQPSRFRQVEQKWVGMNTSRERFERESARLREQMARRKVERLKEMKINWQRIALELRKHMPLEQASRKLGRHKGWLNQIARGEIREPSFSDGLNLLDLAYDRIGAERLRELA